MTIVIKGRLTEADHKSHVAVPFEVPEGTVRLAGRFWAAPERARGALFDNLLSLSLFGPAGPRGARHNNPDPDFVLEAGAASPGYLPGPIEPGAWTLFIDVFRLLGPDPVDWRLEIDCEAQARLPVPAPRPAPAAPLRGPGWFRGDLRAHTLHSDGSWDVPDLAAWARRRGLDFVTLTDHNTISGHAEALALAGPDLAVLRGLELTTHHGHALSLGGAEWREWRTGAVTGRTMAGLATDAMAAGSRFVIAHPMAPGDPACTGCRWEFADVMPGPARLVEVWNGPWSDYNEDSLRLALGWLAEGHRLGLTAGTDIHGLDDDGPSLGFNVVEAAAPTEAALLAAVAAGRGFLSSGPRLVLSATGADGATAIMGEEAEAPATVEVGWTSGDEALTLTFLGQEGALARRSLPPRSGGVEVGPAAPPGFIVAELRDSTGQLQAITNPIFVRPSRNGRVAPR